MTTLALPMHPELVVDQPQLVRWVVPPGTVPFVGPVRSVPGRLGELVLGGVIRQIECESCVVRTTLADGEVWADRLSEARAALASAIADGGAWGPYDDTQRGADALLTAAVHEVLAGQAGDYVRSHGGSVTVASVADGRVEVTFDGTCGHCPATGITLHDRLETEVRRKYPSLVSIAATNSGPRNGKRLFSIRRRPGC